MLLVVADTSPLLYLSRLGLLELLPGLYETVWIPRGVWVELVERQPDAVGAASIRAATWLRIDDQARRVPDVLQALAAVVDEGEAEAILLAELRGADLVLLDDGAARAVAQRRGLRPRGTLAVLVDARRAGLLPALEAALDGLAREGFRMTPALRAWALRAAGEPARKGG